jgi:hypothetical protein
MLAFGITIGESCNISSKNMHDMELLSSSFVDNFPYHERYIVQNIHSVKHFAVTVIDFGPLFNFSTFNYESVIGRITSKFFFSSYVFFLSCIGYLSASIHGTKHIGTELVTNLQLFKQTHIASKNHCSSSCLSPFIEYLETKKKHYRQQQLSTEPISQDDLDLLYRLIPREYKIRSMKSSKS